MDAAATGSLLKNLSLLCVLLMKKSFSDSPVAGQFIVHMHSDHQ